MTEAARIVLPDPGLPSFTEKVLLQILGGVTYHEPTKDLVLSSCFVRMRQCSSLRFARLHNQDYGISKRLFAALDKLATLQTAQQTLEVRANGGCEITAALISCKSIDKKGPMCGR